MNMEIRAFNIRIDGDHVPSADFEILLRFVCEFVVEAGGTEVFREVEFPLVEFTAQLAEWQGGGCAGDFDFESMDSAVRGLVYFHRSDAGAWQVGSTLVGSPPPRPVTTGELQRSVEAFLASVPAAIDPFGVDVRRFLRPKVMGGPA